MVERVVEWVGGWLDDWLEVAVPSNLVTAERRRQMVVPCSGRTFLSAQIESNDRRTTSEKLDAKITKGK